MRPGTTLSLIRQQHMTDLALKLTPQAVILGRILDDDGEPVANAQVMVVFCHLAPSNSAELAAAGAAGALAALTA